MLHQSPDIVINTVGLNHRILTPERELHVLRDINLQISAGEQVAITGRSGSGKSTLLGLLAALDSPSEGAIYLCGHPVHQLQEEARAALRLQHIGFIFQSFQLLPYLSALDNVMLPIRLLGNVNVKSAKEQAFAMLERVGLDKQSQQIPKVLSGGEQQRVAIARALILQPQIVFADEPTGNLDGDTANDIERLFFELNKEQDTTLIVVTHDLDLAAKCQRRLDLQDGHLVEV
ncbi:Lipoprotein-releasing system ATP-binding protein LolD [Oligella ureolytica]|uniref:ABC transporter ATP-binding protein n=1 Tax=Oligella ureolytica TaxID=90244 RepID=A0A378XIH5_9BURK|nr:ABC transporter ATP-binding protein [Oligella ureolytica]QPT39406.1 ABC transporter ATP-binding protein [Oligella ureolytica]SUA56043.1 Lipoprotein-releasing system ATP-binding protein LolD [Oligella ureolytica]SUA57377.1 Lipoprotein-releasing system ATP-binding protein LolD [Oligella ureolytica]